MYAATAALASIEEKMADLASMEALLAQDATSSDLTRERHSCRLDAMKDCIGIVRSELSAFRRALVEEPPAMYGAIVYDYPLADLPSIRIYGPFDTAEQAMAAIPEDVRTIYGTTTGYTLIRPGSKLQMELPRPSRTIPHPRDPSPYDAEAAAEAHEEDDTA